MSELHDAAVRAVARARSPKPGGSELAGRLAVAAIANDPKVQEAMARWLSVYVYEWWATHADETVLADAILRALGGRDE